MQFHGSASNSNVADGALQSPKADNAFSIRSRVVFGAFLTMFLLIGCGGWAVTAQLEGAVVTTGAIKVDQNLKDVQHKDGGIVKSLSVRQGDFVRRGQVLLVLDDVQINAELLIAKSQLAESLSRKARLVAERDNLQSVTFPASLLTIAGSEDAVEGERRLFQGNKLARDSQKSQLELSISQTGEEINGMEARLAAKRQEIALVGAEQEKLNLLYERKIVDYSRVYAARRDWARILGERGEIEAGIARAKARTSEIRVQILAIDQNAGTEAQRDLRAVDARLSELAERKLAIEDRLARTEIRAPVSGNINELSAYTVGGVITPAAKIATIVPESAELRFEIKVMPADIDQIRVGQKARVRLTAFSQSTTPEMKALVVLVSPASTRDPTTGQDHYTAVVEVAEDEIGALKGLRLVPGMPVEVFIATQQRTAASYLIKPFTDQMNRAFRER